MREYERNCRNIYPLLMAPVIFMKSRLLNLKWLYMCTCLKSKNWIISSLLPLAIISPLGLKATVSTLLYHSDENENLRDIAWL